MHILIHSNGPHVPTGYGKQAGYLGRILRDHGHQVTFSAYYGVSGAPLKWKGFPILPAGTADFGADVLVGHAIESKADAVITLMDHWKLTSIAADLRGLPFRIFPWIPVDCSPLGRGDAVFLGLSQAKPIAMTLWGYDKLTEVGFPAYYAPHTFDGSVMHPPTDDERKAARAAMGLDGKFAVGICAANRDAVRKGFAEQFGAFARFAAQEPAAVLLIHAMASPPGGLNLPQMAEDFDIGDRVIFSGQYEQVTGTYTEREMAAWFSAIDVLSACSMGEGFGVPVVEAQACGTPVITTAGTATDELTHKGWRVKGSRFWNPIHRAWWVRPDEDAIYRAYRSARELAESRRGAAVAHVAPFEYERVKADFWPAILDDIEAGSRS